MKIYDTHSDALCKLWEGGGGLRFADADRLQTNLARLNKGEVALQCFAIFVPPDVPGERKFQVALSQIDYFHREILQKHTQVRHITTWDGFDQLRPDEIGALLTLEGVDPIGDDLTKLRTLYRLGVMSVGLTWNFANFAADGSGEKRNAGLSLFGEEAVRLNNAYRVLTDVSHLSEASFWDVLGLAQYPIASHSNAKAICNHVRNLNDDQAQALFAKDGYVGLVFNPPFINEEGVEGVGTARVTTIDDLLRHLDHFCALGGIRHVGFGSDFDGITTFVEKLEHAAHYQNLINVLLRHYKEEEVEGFAYKNFLSCIQHHFPTGS